MTRWFFVERRFNRGRYVVVGFGRTVRAALACFADLRRGDGYRGC